jgi:transcriptional regulator with XRE-family HTH domain
MLNATTESLGTTIRRRRRKMGLTLDDLAEQTGVSKPYLSLIENDRPANPPRDEKLRKLEQALGFAESELLRQAHLQRTPQDVRAMLMGLTEARAARQRVRPMELGPGSLNSAVTPLADTVGWPDVGDRKAFAARVCDDSMSPAYGKGEIVVFSPSLTAVSGDDCYVRLADGRTTFHRIFFETGEKGQAVIRLQPRNQRHRPTIVAADQVTAMHKAVYRYLRIEGE